MTVAVVGERGVREHASARAWCPFLTSETGDRLSTCPGGVSCDLPLRESRVPSKDELAWFCTEGHYWSCPRFRECLATMMRNAL